MGGSGAHPARCWAQTRPGHARRGPLGSGPTSPPCRGRAGHCPSPAGPTGGPASEEKGYGYQKGGRNSGWDPERQCRSRHRHTGDAQHTKHTRAHTQWESPSSGCRNWPQAEFPTVLASKLHLGVTWLLPFRRGGGPRPFIFKLNTDPVTGWVEMEEKNAFACPLV